MSPIDEFGINHDKDTAKKKTNDTAGQKVIYLLKKINPLIFIIVPTLYGYLHNKITAFMVSIPIISILYWYGLPILMVCFWFWVGGRFALHNKKAIPSILLGNSIGMISLSVFLWQFLFVSSANIDYRLSYYSQMFISGVGIFAVRIAALFEPQRNVTGRVTINGMQIIGVILMIIIFSAGYFYYKRKAGKVQN